MRTRQIGNRFPVAAQPFHLPDRGPGRSGGRRVGASAHQYGSVGRHVMRVSARETVQSVAYTALHMVHERRTRDGAYLTHLTRPCRSPAVLPFGAQQVARSRAET